VTAAAAAKTDNFVTLQNTPLPSFGFRDRAYVKRLLLNHKGKGNRRNIPHHEKLIN